MQYIFTLHTCSMTFFFNYCCVQVWGFRVAHDETRLITGCSDSELKVWKITSSTESDAEESEKSNEKRDGKRSAEEAGLNDESEEKTAEVHANQCWKGSRFLNCSFLVTFCSCRKIISIPTPFHSISVPGSSSYNNLGTL